MKEMPLPYSSGTTAVNFATWLAIAGEHDRIIVISLPILVVATRRLHKLVYRARNSGWLLVIVRVCPTTAMTRLLREPDVGVSTARNFGGQPASFPIRVQCEAADCGAALEVQRDLKPMLVWNANGLAC